MDVRIITSDYIIPAVRGIVYFCDASAGPLTLTCSHSGDVWDVWIKKIDSTGNKITIQGPVSHPHLFDGLPTLEIKNPYGCYHLIHFGTNHYVLSYRDKAA